MESYAVVRISLRPLDGKQRVVKKESKASVSYKIKVNTDKPINEVHLNLKETDAGGKVRDKNVEGCLRE